MRAEQQAALEDHSAELEARVERIGRAQIREKVIAADLKHDHAPRSRLVDALRDAAKRLGPPAQAVYAEERERRLADVLAELRQTLDPGIVHSLESIEEPGHADSARSDAGRPCWSMRLACTRGGAPLMAYEWSCPTSIPMVSK